MPITELKQPCWEATCDRCGRGTNPDYEGSSYHHESLDAAVAHLQAAYWTVVRNDQGKVTAVYCDDCLGDMSQEERAEHGITNSVPFDQEAVTA